MTDEAVAVSPQAPPAAPSAGDVSFWNSKPYRSGDEDWREFLDIDTPDVDPPGPDALGSDTSGPDARGPGAPCDECIDSGVLDSPLAELADLADPIESDAPRIGESGDFDFFAGTPDDFLPQR